ncbi:hypothetical protein PCANB_000131 [Pneumocystis canis]|nr:hypothetical protein PCK1_000071 [Pneumocystis canis]KAG5439849.1 hypothetical protein PCANB_000131 [Pneumocystis canis]
MESTSLQDKLEAAKKHMIQVKKKKRENSSIINTQNIHNETFNETNKLSKITDEKLSKDHIQEILLTINEMSTEKIDLDQKNELSIIDKRLHVEKNENDHIKEPGSLHNSLDINKYNVHDTELLKQNIEITSSELQFQPEKILSNDKQNFFESIKALENTMNEMKSQIIFLQKNYLEINEKLNTILLKVDTNNMLLQKSKKTESIEYEKISKLETVIKELENKLEKAQNNSQNLLISPIIANQTLPQISENQSFEDISLNSINTSPVIKKKKQISHEICKIDLRTTGGCVGCLGDMFEV